MRLYLCIRVQQGSFATTSLSVEAIYFFEIIAGETGQPLFRQQVAVGEEILYTYIHSSDGTPIEHLFVFREDGLLHLLETRYAWHGAGMEFEPGLSFDFEGEMVVVTGFDSSFASLPIRVAWTVPQKIIIGSQMVLLADLAAGGASLAIRVVVEE